MLPVMALFMSGWSGSRSFRLPLFDSADTGAFFAATVRGVSSAWELVIKASETVKVAAPEIMALFVRLMNLINVRPS